MPQVKTKFKETVIGLIPEEWQSLSVDSICEVIKNQYKPSSEDAIPYIGLEHIDQQSLRLNSIGRSSEVTSNKFLFSPNDVLFGKLRPYFRKVYQPDFSGICSTDILVIRAKKCCDDRFLFYFIANQDFIEESISSSQGTRMPRANWDYLKNTEWAIPPLPEQKSIAEILSSLDEKIELNRRMNETLEEIGKTLFKRWFVDFEFPNEDGKPYKSSGGAMVDGDLGVMPVECQVNRLENLCTYISRGVAPAYTNQEGVRVINQRCIRNGYVSFSESRHTDPIKKKVIPEKFLQELDIVINSTGTGTLGRIAQLWTAHGKLTFDSHVTVVRADKSKIDPIYLGFYLKRQQILIEDLAEGSTGQTELPREKLKQFSLIVPSKKIMAQFSVAVSSLNELINENFQAIETLNALRDKLLPKLILGRIRTEA